MTDWRIDLSKWTRDAKLRFKKYEQPSEDWDHDHCEACMTKFMESGRPGILTAGYVTEDNYRWICPKCFEELKEEMAWKL
jgi:hypothetical protein